MKIEVKSKEIQMVDIGKIVVNPRNNNRHNPDQIDLLCEMIKARGFRNPLTISNRSGFLVCGELRYTAACKLGMKELPCIYQDFKDEAEEYAHLTADNEIAKQSQLDYQQVLIDVEELKMSNEEVELMGIKPLEENVIEYDEVTNDNEDRKPKQKLPCPNCGFID